MKKILLLIAVFLVAGMTAWSQVKVTFTVDMQFYWKGGTFSPVTDTVRVAGDMNGWSTTATTLVKGTGADSAKYSGQVSGIAAGDIHYKFIFINSKGVQWEDDQATTSHNREATIGATDVVLPTVLFNNITGKLNHVKFQVDMSVPIKAGKVIIGTTNVYVAGDMTDWGNRADLMTKGASDSIYTIIEDSMASGSTRNFKFIYSATTPGAGTWESDPNRTYFVPEKDSTVFLDYWDRQNPNVQLGNGDVNFTLDMTVMINAGIYNNVKDSVLISGGFNGWTTTDPTQFLNRDPLNPKTYFITHSFVSEPFGAKPFKYVVVKHTTGIDSVWIDGYERPVNWGGNNRETLFQGTTKDTTDWYDGIHPDWAIPNGTNLKATFKLDMTDAMDPIKQPVPFDPAKDTVYWSSGEPAFAATQHWYRAKTNGHIKNVPMIATGVNNIYTATIDVIEPSFNAFEYNYEWQKGSDQSWISEPAGLGIDFAYRVRYAGQDVANHFPKNPWIMPKDTWTFKDLKTDQEKDPYASFIAGIKTENLNPVSYSLSQNYPNPFNPSTTIKFTIQKAGLVSLKIYNLLGQEVATLVNQELKTGSYSYSFNASRLSSGVYFYNINAGSFISTKKMLLLK